MIWIACPKEGAIKREKQSDGKQYNCPQDQYWDGIWRRNDEEYWSVFKPEEIAN